MSSTDAVVRVALQWRDLPDRPVMTPGVIHLVCDRLDPNRAVGARDWELLSGPENARARRFRFEQHRDRWVHGRATLKRLLARYAEVDPVEIRLGFGELGKPRLAWPDYARLCFNYTDSGGYLLYALARDMEVGVDLEHLPRTTGYRSLVRRKLSDIEQAAFARLPEAIQEFAFLACWTRKEAWGKALGVGIRYPMNRTTVCPDFADPAATVDDGAGAPVRLVQFDPPFSGIACVAAVAPRFDLEAFRLT